MISISWVIDTGEPYEAGITLLTIVNTRGHRANSFRAGDINELVEIRARQRTFHGAYSRTALGILGSSLTILRLFDRRFYRSESTCLSSSPICFFLDPPLVGILFAVLGGSLFILAYLRARHSRHDFADRRKEEQEHQLAIKTVGQEGTRIFGRPFRTAGWIVLAMTSVIATVEIGLLVLIMQL